MDPPARVLLLLRPRSSPRTTELALLPPVQSGGGIDALPRLYRLVYPDAPATPGLLLGPGYQPYWLLPALASSDLRITSPAFVNDSAEYLPNRGDANVLLVRETAMDPSASSLRYIFTLRTHHYRWKKPAFSANFRCERRPPPSATAAVEPLGELALAFDTSVHPYEAVLARDPATNEYATSQPFSIERIGTFSFPGGGPLHRDWSEMEESALVTLGLLILEIARGERRT